jgi:hypothetical protein
MGVTYIIPPAGTPASAFSSPAFIDPARPPAILARKIDPRTGGLLSLFAGMDPVDAAIALELRIERGSGAAVQDRGHRLRDIRKNTEDAPARIRHELERILTPFIDEGNVELVEEAVEAGEGAGDAGAAFVRYRNLRTGETGKVAP